MTIAPPVHRPPSGAGPDPGRGAGGGAGIAAAPAAPSETTDICFWSTLLGALAVLASMTAIPPMVSGDSWLWPTIEVVAVIWLVGVGARLARLPAAVVVLLQLAAAAVALTALFTTGGFGGVIPNAAAFSDAGDLLDGAWEQIRTSVSPAASSTELAFLIALAVGLTALIVDMLIAVCRAPALVALPLLCMYSVPASIDLGMLPWEAFAGPAVLYALLLAVDGLSGRRTDGGAATATILSGIVLAAVAVVVALLVSSSVTSIGTAGRLPRGGNSGASGIGLSPFASLSGNLQRTDPVPLLRVSGLSEPNYLRTVGLQKWTPGEGWSVDTLSNGALPTGGPAAAGAGSTDQITVTSLAYRDQFLPIYDGISSISGLDAGWYYDAALEAVHRQEPIDPGAYQLTVSTPAVSADELRADTVTTGGSLIETGPLADEVVTLSQQVTAGATTAFDKADALRSWFTNPANGFVYSLAVPSGDSGDALVDFLNNKQGFCEQYASAMAVMLRAAGVPARVAVGFTQGVKDADGTYVISSNDAHAWVEVLFNDAGWVRFDPTPLGGGQGGQQGFTDATAAPTTAPTTTGPATAGGSVPEELRPSAGDIGSAPGQNTAAGGSAAKDSTVSSTLWWLLAIVLALAAAAAGPTVVRNRRRTRRRSMADAGGPGAAAAVWSEVEDLAVDHGIVLNAAESARAVANRLARATHLPDQERATLRTLVMQVEHGWYAPPGPQTAGQHIGQDPGQDIREPVVDGPPTAEASTGNGRPTASGWPDGLSAGRDGPREMRGGSPASGDGRAHSAAGGQPQAPGHDTVTMTRTRPQGGESLWPAATAIADALDRNAPLSLIERLVPRSVRPAWWRE
jgi:transglutaminase-like putative cysteine protease